MRAHLRVIQDHEEPRRVRIRHTSLTREEYARMAETEVVLAAFERPHTRGDCLAGGINEARPCPFVSCAHHLYLEVTEEGFLHLNHPGLELGDLPDTCALDVADRGGAELTQVAARMGLKLTRLKQLIRDAQEKARNADQEAE